MYIYTKHIEKCDKRNNRDKHAIANVAYFDFDPSEELYREFGHLDMKRFLTLMTIVAAVAPVQRSWCGGLMQRFDAEPDVEVWCEDPGT